MNRTQIFNAVFSLSLASFLFCANGTAALARENFYRLQGNFALVPPPQTQSEEYAADYDEILKLQSTRTADDCKRAAHEVKVTIETFYGKPYGPLSQDETQKLNMLFEKVAHDTNVIVQEAKRKWAKPRPYFANNNVNPCVHKETTGAYPSGHAAIALSTAKVLGELFPEQKIDFELRARQIGDDRVLSGVHHPSDIRAGRELGARVFASLMKDPKFQADLKKFRAAVAPKKAAKVSGLH